MRRAARDKHNHACTFVRPPPHVGGGLRCPTRPVEINGFVASVFGDPSACEGVGSAPTRDAVIAGCLSVFIKGEPATRQLETTYGGFVVEGSPNVYYATKVTPLGRYAADWLTRYLAQQTDIPFEFAPDGCYARADVMKDIMRKQFGMEFGEVKKIIVEGDLRPAALQGGAWGWHIAPTVAGVDPSGAPTRYVIDPSLRADAAMTASEWVDTSKGSGFVRDHWVDDEDVYNVRGVREGDPAGGGKTLKEWGREILVEYKKEAQRMGLMPPGTSLSGPTIPPPHVP